MGHTVVVLTNEEDYSDDDALEQRIDIIRKGKYTASRWGLVRRAFLVKQEIDRFLPDYVLVGDARAHRVFAHVRYASQVPYCIVFHGTDLKSLKDAVLHQGWSPRRFLIKCMLVGCIRRASQVICVSQYTANTFLEIDRDHHRPFILSPCVSEIFLTRPVNHGFKAVLPKRWGFSLDNEPVKFITVARISERKNQLRVLEMLCALRRTQRLHFHYFIVGNVDAHAHLAYMQKIQELIASNGLEDIVTIIPNTTDEDKIDYLDFSDIFIMLSQRVGNSVEGFGISAIEASCRGKPIIVSDQGGMPETVLHGQSGFVVPVHDDAAITTAMMTLANDTQRRNTMGACGREYVLKNFTTKTMASRLVQQLRVKSS